MSKASTRGGVDAVPGSFRDPSNRVYRVQTSAKDKSATRILRGCNAVTADYLDDLLEAPFFREAVNAGKIIRTEKLEHGDESAARIMREDGWKCVLEHDPVPFVSYPYEWSHSMLLDAALLQLDLLEAALESGWTIKDSTPYNIQWIGSQPVFIDIPSFEPWADGEGWLGYRQFCSLFLTPLLLRKHLGIGHGELLRSNLDGIPPTEAAKYFYGMKRFARGVPSHILLPARVEKSILSRERDQAQAQQRAARKQSKAMVIGLVQSMRRLVDKLRVPLEHTDWSHYDRTHTYVDTEYEAKQAFVRENTARKKRNQVWDIGCNTGTFSRIAAENADYVIALDGDHDAIEQLYARHKQERRKDVLPLVMNLANISPDHGWAGRERTAFDKRQKPDLILCLALIHHIRISANIPNRMFLDWLRSTGADVILEFVDRHDEMVVKLLTNKKEQYADYTLEQFHMDVAQYFDVAAERALKGGKRRIFYLTPKRG